MVVMSGNSVFQMMLVGTYCSFNHNHKKNI